MTQDTFEFNLNIVLLVVAVLTLVYKLVIDLWTYLHSEDGIDRLHEVYRALPYQGQLKIATILIKVESIKRKRRRLHERHH